MVPEIHLLKVNLTLFNHAQFGIPKENTVIENGEHTNLFFRFNENIYKISSTGVRNKQPKNRFFYFTPDMRKFILENDPSLSVGTEVKIEIFSV